MTTARKLAGGLSPRYAGHFAVTPIALLDDERIKALDIAVYAALDSFVDTDGKCWPSLATIAKRAKTSVDSVIRSLKRLENCVYIKVTRRKIDGRKEADSNLYFLPFRVGEVVAKSNNVVAKSVEVVADSGNRCRCERLEVVAVSGRNYTHRTIPNEEYPEERKDSADSSAKGKPVTHISKLSQQELRNIPATINIAIELWNTYLSPEGFSKILKTTPTRERHFKARLSENPALRGNALWWWALVGKIAESSFLRDNAQKWMSFDWILSESNLTKIIEGKYDDKDAENADDTDLIPVLVEESEVAV